MAVVNPKNYFGLEMDELTKTMFIERYVSEVPEPYKELRHWYAVAYTTNTSLNYVVSKEAQATIEKIKLDDPFKVLSLILDNADPEGATFLLNKDEFFRYLPINDRGTEDMMCVYMKKTPVNTLGRDLGDFYINYESWRLTKGEINHPTDNRLAVILQFIKTMIFIKCSNIERYVMEPQQKSRPSGMEDKKWINKSGTEVVLINADWNRMYVRTEGFDVQGHIRFQRHGKGNQEVKIIFINSYRKKGYQQQFHSH